MKQTYEFKEWQEGRDAYIVIVEWTAEPIYGEGDYPTGYHEDLKAVFVSKWRINNRQGKRWSQKKAQVFVNTRRAKLLEAIHDLQQSQHETWEEQQAERRLGANPDWRSVFT